MISKGPTSFQSAPVQAGFVLLPSQTQQQEEKQGFTKLIDHDVAKSYKSQLSINKAFSSNEFAQRFCVCNPRKASDGDHIVYTVFGEDYEGKFEI